MYKLELAGGSKKHKSWVAEIKGEDAKFGFERKFIDPVEYGEWQLADGIYNTKDASSDRVEYLVISEGEATVIDESEVLSYLNTEVSVEATEEAEVVAAEANDKSALTVFAETAGITMYQIAKENGIANSTIINAFKKSVDQLSIRVLKSVAATAEISAGELLNILIKIENNC